MRTIAVLVTERSHKYHARPSRDGCISIQQAKVTTLGEAKNRGLRQCECFDILGYVPTEGLAPWELIVSD